MRILLIEPNFFNALNIKKGIIAKYSGSVKENDVVWANSVESAALMLQNSASKFDSIVVNGKPASLPTLQSLGLAVVSDRQPSSSKTATVKTATTKNRTNFNATGIPMFPPTMPPTCNIGGHNDSGSASNMQGLQILYRDLDRLENQVSELKTYAERNSNCLFEEVEKFENMLFNATGGGLMSRVEKLGFAVEELDEKLTEIVQAIKQLEDFKYNISGVVHSVKEKQDSSSFQKSKAWEYTIMTAIGLLTALFTFGLGKFSTDSTTVPVTPATKQSAVTSLYSNG